LGERLLDGWSPARVQEEPLDDCRYTTSVWKPKAGEGLLRLDVYEEPSRQAAEVRLLGLLDNFQSPRVRRDGAANYPLFRYGEDTTLAFSRGNLTFFAANAERKVVPLGKVLRDLERLFTAEPEESATVAQAVTLARIPEARVGQAVPLQVS